MAGLAGLVLGLVGLAAVAEGRGFGGIPGDYCRIRTPEQCWVSRDDECTMPILGNHLCYCDMFCARGEDGDDCCPDFEPVCKGVTPAPVRSADCSYNGVSYGEGDRTTQNCNECTCVGAAPNSRWSCSNNPCMIEQDILDGVNQGRYS